jgi:hypothetical protein
MRVIFVLALATASFFASAAQPLPGYIQLLVGELHMSDDNVVIDRGGLEYEGSVDSIPYLGGAVQMPTKNDIFGYGYEAGGFVSWENDEVSYLATSGSNGTTVRIRVDNSFFLFETFLGAYGAFKPTERLRFYTGAGPLFLYARAESEDLDDDATSNTQPSDEGKNSDNDFSIGWYARAGVDLGITKDTWVGLNVRHIESNLNLSKSVGKFDIDGEMYLISVTHRY